MSFKKPKILIVLIFSAILRVWGLGVLPRGLSVKEAELGLSLSGLFGNLSYSPFFLRLPFFLLGIFSIYLFYLVIKKLTKNVNFALISSILLTLTPWHFIESRIYSPGIIVFTLSLFFLLLILDKKSLVKKSTKVVPLLVIAVFLVSTLFAPADVANQVDRERNLAVETGFNLPIRPFSNKLIASYRQREALIFENLDFGNYFFMGHPRERLGVEENQKFFVSLLPLFLVGLFLIKKKEGLLLLSWAMVFIFLPGIVGKRLDSLAVSLSFPFLFVTTKGLIHLWSKKRKMVLYLLGAIFLFELLFFGESYFSQISESRFSPRQSYYIELVESVREERQEGERVLVTKRIDSPETFFKFYLKEKTLENYEFRTFDISQEPIKDGLFVDILPDDPSPVEPLVRDGEYPPEIEVLDEIRDDANNRTVVLYRYN